MPVCPNFGSVEDLNSVVLKWLVVQNLVHYESLNVLFWGRHVARYSITICEQNTDS